MAGETVDDPPYLPEGWETRQFVSPLDGSLYIRFFKGQHTSILTVQRCIYLDAQDRGLDPDVAVRAYQDKKMKAEGFPEEQFRDFPPEKSGLDEVALAALPPEQPLDSKAFDKARANVDATGNRRVNLTFDDASGRKIGIQVTANAVGGSIYACFRIARACYAKFEEGFDKDAVLKFRTECVDKFKAATGSVPEIEQGSKKTKRRKDADLEKPEDAKAEAEELLKEEKKTRANRK